MAYAIHIERDPPLTLEEWKEAVRTTNGVRLNAGGASFTNPATGEVIAIGGVEGDAEIKIGGKWHPCFQWRDSGAVVFGASDDFRNPKSATRRLARELTAKLAARLRGDEGEEYD